MIDRKRPRRLPMIALSTAGLLAVGGGWIGAQQQAPSSGLNLEDIFEVQPGTDAWQAAPNRFDPQGPLLFLPDTSAWRLPAPPPTPQPTPTPMALEGADIPTLPPAIASADQLAQATGQEAFRSQGEQTGAVSWKDQALLEVTTGYTRLGAEYRLVPVAEPGQKPREDVRWLHAPGTTESFAVPAGTWRLERWMWEVDQPGRRQREEYRPQVLRGGFRYQFVPVETDQDRILR